MASLDIQADGQGNFFKKKKIMRPNMMEFAISSQQLFQPLGQIWTIFAFDPGRPVIASGADDNMLGVGRRGVR